MISGPMIEEMESHPFAMFFYCDRCEDMHRWRGGVVARSCPKQIASKTKGGDPTLPPVAKTKRLATT